MQQMKVMAQKLSRKLKNINFLNFGVVCHNQVAF